MVTAVLIKYSENDCIKIPVGDEIILCLGDNSNKILEIVQGVMEKNEAHNRDDSLPKFELRCAINYGSVLEYKDINGCLNLAGPGINDASRILSISKKNQILVSDDFYKFIFDPMMNLEKSSLLNCFSDPVENKVKHDEIKYVRNFCILEKNIGIPYDSNFEPIPKNELIPKYDRSGKIY